MQEHIRRAHPNHYIPKLPATEESFQLMVNTPPDQRPHQPPPQPPPNTNTTTSSSTTTSGSTISANTPSTASHSRRGLGTPLDRDSVPTDHHASVTPRTIEEAHPAAATAAVALAQLHHHRLNSEWDSEAVCPSYLGPYKYT